MIERITAAEAREALNGAAKKHKYNITERPVIDGYEFGSPAEGKRYILLKHRQAIGEIAGLAVHPQFTLTVNGLKVGRYTADFSYFENGKYIVDEEKGFRARDWPLRSRLFMALNPDIRLIVNGEAAKPPKPPKQARVVRAA